MAVKDKIKGEVQRGVDEAGQKIAEMKGGVLKWLETIDFS